MVELFLFLIWLELLTVKILNPSPKDTSVRTEIAIRIAIAAACGPRRRSERAIYLMPLLKLCDRSKADRRAKSSI